MKKFQRSQNAHLFLRKKATLSLGKDRFAPKKYQYHDRVYRIQQAKGKIFSVSERRKIYKSS